MKDSTENTLYHFVGIKGAGMSALALVLNGKGYNVQGSDIDKYCFTQRELEKAQIPIMSFNVDNIQDNENMVVIAGNAFPDTHPEISEALNKKIPVIRYHKFLSSLSSEYTSVAVTGSHGKTSTTGMLAHVLNGLAPTSYLIGDGTGYGVDDAKYFAFEACEYKRHFLAYEPDYAIMTNIDYDHPDYFTSIEDVADAFQSLANRVKKAIFAYGDDSHLRNLTAKVPIYYYGVKEDDDFQVVDIQRTTNGSSFDVRHNGEIIGHFEIPTYGMHNIYNATAVIAVAYMENESMEKVAQELTTYKGVKRRFTEKEVGDMMVIDDYAHHPSEIKATIDAARQKYPDKEIIAVFQPHTFTRTVALLHEFAESLDLADHVYLCDIFGSARETSGDVRIEDLAAEITKVGTIVKEDNVSPLLDYQNAVIIFMGAGDVQKFERAYENLYFSTQKSI